MLYEKLDFRDVNRQKLKTLFAEAELKLQPFVDFEAGTRRESPTFRVAVPTLIDFTNLETESLTPE